MVVSLAGLFAFAFAQVHSFSMNMNMGAAMNLMSSDSNKLDRFRSVFLVGTESKAAITEFDDVLWSSLYDNNDNESNEKEDLWVAVYRSNNNKPSVIVRDDFFRAMNDATTASDDAGKTTDSDDADTKDSNNNISTVSSAASFLSDTMPSMLQVPSTKPVAIARLQKSDNNDNDDNVYLLGHLRCSLKKEDQENLRRRKRIRRGIECGGRYADPAAFAALA